MLQSEKEIRKGAIALGYDQSKNGAPKVIAKGYGELAERIISIAKENKILIKDDPLLFESLKKLETGEEIPAKLYQVIAELLAFVYKVNKKYQRGKK